jgi:hypothetical protein
MVEVKNDCKSKEGVIGGVTEADPVRGRHAFRNVSASVSAYLSTYVPQMFDTTVDGINYATLWLIALVRFAPPLPNLNLRKHYGSKHLRKITFVFGAKLWNTCKRI